MAAAHTEGFFMLRTITLSLLVAATGLSSALAQPADVANRPTLTLDGAKAVANFAVHYAREHQAPGAAIAMVDSGGTLLYVERLDETFQNAANISIGKARTAVLFGKPTRVFEDLVNKSYRAGPGEAEVQVNDTDIFYALKGRAELIVGGNVSDSHAVSATEIRGSKIEGGEARKIAKGDVVAIPRGIPHWFKQVSTP